MSLGFPTFVYKAIVAILGHKANDKTVKLEEQRKIGYGVRAEKQQHQRETKPQSLGVK